MQLSGKYDIEAELRTILEEIITLPILQTSKKLN